MVCINGGRLGGCVCQVRQPNIKYRKPALQSLLLSKSKHAICRYGSGAINEMNWTCNNGTEVTSGESCRDGNVAEGMHYSKYTCESGNIARGGMVWNRCEHGLTPDADVTTCTVGT